MLKINIVYHTKAKCGYKMATSLQEGRSLKDTSIEYKRRCFETNMLKIFNPSNWTMIQFDRETTE